jgi:universal stress protein A
MNVEALRGRIAAASMPTWGRRDAGGSWRARKNRPNFASKAGTGVTEEGITMDVRQISAPTDFSEFSKRAVESAYALAQTFGAKLLLLSVVELPSFPVEGLAPSTRGTMLLDDLQRQVSLNLAQVLQETTDPKVEVTRQVVVGTPYRQIVEVAEAEHVDLIVMATHGRTGLSHLVMGSVAERVVRTAACPVLTIRPTAATA